VLVRSPGMRPCSGSCCGQLRRDRYGLGPVAGAVEAEALEEGEPGVDVALGVEVTEGLAAHLIAGRRRCSRRATQSSSPPRWRRSARARWKATQPARVKLGLTSRRRGCVGSALVSSCRCTRGMLLRSISATSLSTRARSAGCAARISRTSATSDRRGPRHERRPSARTRRRLGSASPRRRARARVHLQDRRAPGVLGAVIEVLPGGDQLVAPKLAVAGPEVGLGRVGDVGQQEILAEVIEVPLVLAAAGEAAAGVAGDELTQRLGAALGGQGEHAATDGALERVGGGVGEHGRRETGPSRGRRGPTRARSAPRRAGRRARERGIWGWSCGPRRRSALSRVRCIHSRLACAEPVMPLYADGREHDGGKGRGRGDREATAVEGAQAVGVLAVARELDGEQRRRERGRDR
jgi:hypothetical protein